MILISFSLCDLSQSGSFWVNGRRSKWWAPVNIRPEVQRTNKEIPKCMGFIRWLLLFYVLTFISDESNNGVWYVLQHAERFRVHTINNLAARNLRDCMIIKSKINLPPLHGSSSPFENIILLPKFPKAAFKSFMQIT